MQKLATKILMLSISLTSMHTYCGIKAKVLIQSFPFIGGFLRQTYTIRLQIWQVNVGNIYLNIRSIAIYTAQGILPKAWKAGCPKENRGSRLFF